MRITPGSLFRIPCSMNCIPIVVLPCTANLIEGTIEPDGRFIADGIALPAVAALIRVRGLKGCQALLARLSPSLKP